MALSAFDDKSHRPGADDLERVLAKSAPLWRQLIGATAEWHGPIAEDWNFAGAKYGWSLRLKKGDRIVSYLTPQSGEFLFGIVVGPKAAAKASVPAAVRKLLDESPHYGEGIGIRLSIRRKIDVTTARHLTAVKLST